MPFPAGIMVPSHRHCRLFGDSTVWVRADAVGSAPGRLDPHHKYWSYVMNRLRLGMLSLVGFVWLGCSAAGSNNNGGTGGNPGTGGGVGTGGGFGSGGVEIG